MSGLPSIPRDMLAEAFPGQPRLVAAFEEQSVKVEEASAAVSTQKEATDALEDAYFLTLSPNATLKNERVLDLGEGLQAIDDGTLLKISVSNAVAHVEGDQPVTFLATGSTTLLLPVSGTLATRSGAETFSNKTLQAPKLAGLGDFADDAAAATGGVPVGGVYRTGSALKVRVS
jgi:hypothetical protein